MTDERGKTTTDERAQPGLGAMKPMLLMMFSMILFMIAISQYQVIGPFLDVVLHPLIGFGDKHPFWTIACSAFVVAFVSSLVTHLNTDWIQQGKTRHIQSTFQKEMREAMRTKNTYKMKRLQEMQPEITQMAQTTMSTKTMMLPMLITIPFWVWLWYFLGNLWDPVMVLPWGGYGSLSAGARRSLFSFPWFIIVYMVISMPSHQFFTRLWKTIKWHRMQ